MKCLIASCADSVTGMVIIEELGDNVQLVSSPDAATTGVGNASATMPHKPRAMLRITTQASCLGGHNGNYEESKNEASDSILVLQSSMYMVAGL